MHSSFKKGFTLIELLVVISIIGLMSSIVLASVKSAREKARIAAGQKFDTTTMRTYGASAIGIWNFNEGSGSIANDTSGNSFNGTLVNGPTWVQGQQGSALNFNGSNYVVPTNIASRVDLTDQAGSGRKIMITAWIRPTTYNASYHIFLNSVPGIQYIGVGPTRAMYSVALANGNPRWLTSNAKIPLNEWTHVGLLVEESVGYKYYINGKLDKEFSMSDIDISPVGADPTGLGKTYNSVISSYNWIGDLDSVRVFYPVVR